MLQASSSRPRFRRWRVLRGAVPIRVWQRDANDRELARAASRITVNGMPRIRYESAGDDERRWDVRKVEAAIGEEHFRRQLERILEKSVLFPHDFVVDPSGCCTICSRLRRRVWSAC